MEMDTIFCRSTYSNSAYTTTSDSKRVVNTKEIIIEDFGRSIDNWEIPKVNKKQTYEKSRSIFFRTDFSIKTEERDIQFSKPFETINLLSQNSLQKI